MPPMSPALCVWPAGRQQGQPVFVILSGERQELCRHIVIADLILCKCKNDSRPEEINDSWHIESAGMERQIWSA